MTISHPDDLLPIANFYKPGRMRPYRTVIHTLPYTDHQGHPACMVFQNRPLCPLPPLYTFAVYFTHPTASPETVDAAGLFHAVHHGPQTYAFRLDLFFLHEASVEDCVTHYRAEKAKRGDYHVQVAAVDELLKAPVSDNRTTRTGSTGRDSDVDAAESECAHAPPSEPRPTGSPASLPGLVPTYIGGYETWNGVLFICPEKDWNTGDRAHELQQVLFDRCDDETWEVWNEESEQTSPSYTKPDMHVEWMPVNQSAPAFRDGLASVDWNMFEVSLLERENLTSPAWWEARKAGWTRWP
ncbi:hypothetical protein BJX61DRAFT_133469 [Aspergillus egyptiacus]|nr:hypothetical protein BJX61DRAFT_133469 [Aspergillus egyptiacus]